MPNLTQEQGLSEAIRLVNRATTGILATLDDNGGPQARWMGFTTMADGLRRIYCLTARTTRKIEQIRRHPDVCWLFSNDDQGHVVTLYGKACVIDSSIVAQQVWDRLITSGHPYIMSTLGDNSALELVAIESRIQRLELLCPRLGIFEPFHIELTPAHVRAS